MYRALILALALPCIAHAQVNNAATVTGLWAGQVDRNTVQLVWKNSGGVRAYRLYRDVGGRPALVATLAGNSNHYVVIVRRGETTLQFYIESMSSTNKSSRPVPFNKVTLVTPTPGAVPAPASVVAREDAGRMVVTWEPVPGATAYQIFRSVGTSGTGTLCGFCPTRTELIDTIVTTNVRYLYAVSAVTPAGVSLRTRSNELTPTTASTVASASGNGPALSGLYAEQVAPSTVHLRWNRATGATTYLITMTDMTGKEVPVARLNADATEYIANLDPRSHTNRNTVQFYIEARDAAGARSGRLAFNNVTLAAGGPPPAPSNVTALQVARGKIQVAWHGSDDARTYEVVRDDARRMRAVVCRACSDTTFVDSTTERGRITYAVSALNASGRSVAVMSNPVDAGAAGSGVPALPAPTALRSQLRGDTITLSWEYASTNATGFRVTRNACGSTKSFDVRFASGRLPRSTARELMSAILKQPECLRATKPVTVQYKVAALYHNLAGDAAALAPMQIGTGTPPAAPTRPAADVVGNIVQLSWQPPRDAVSEYMIRRTVCGIEKVWWVSAIGKHTGTSDAIMPIVSLPECAALSQIRARYTIAAARYGLVGAEVSFPEVVLPRTAARIKP